MVALESGFETKLRESLVTEIETQVIDGPDNLVHQFVQTAHDNLREYGSAHGYDVDPIIDSLGQPDVTRTNNGVIVSVGWDHEATGYFEFGTPRHTVTATNSPVLSFVWEDPPQWVTEEFEQARGGGGRFERGYRVFLPEVDVEGLPEGRWIRDALRYLELIITREFSQGP